MEFEQQREPEDNIEDVNETEDSQEKKSSPEELAKIREELIDEIIETQKDIDDLKNKKGPYFEVLKRENCEDRIEFFVGWMESHIKKLEVAISVLK
ncbi:MAG: hypothetical protein WC520_02865 [Candidatus Paceibacterota bacterium]